MSADDQEPFTTRLTHACPKCNRTGVAMRLRYKSTGGLYADVFCLDCAVEYTTSWDILDVCWKRILQREPPENRP